MCIHVSVFLAFSVIHPDEGPHSGPETSNFNHINYTPVKRELVTKPKECSTGRQCRAGQTDFIDEKTLRL